MVRAVRSLPTIPPRVTVGATSIPDAPKDATELAKPVQLLADAVQRSADETQSALDDLSDVVRMVNVRDIRADRAASPWERIDVDPQGGTVTITLPKAADNEGTRIDVRHSGISGTVAIAAHPDDTINGETTATISIIQTNLSFFADSKLSGWVVI